MNKLYSVAQIREFERQAISDCGISESQLMLSAGQVAFETLQQRYPHASKIAVLCGKGNNGGDGFVLATCAKKAGLDVMVYTVGCEDLTTDVSKQAKDSGVVIQAFDEEAASMLSGGYAPGSRLNWMPEIIVDAMLGIGLEGEVRGAVADAIAAIRLATKQNTATRPAVLAIDCPSGINADSGAVMGAAVQADVTVTFIASKQGLVTGSAPGYVGQLVVNDLGIPSRVFDAMSPAAALISPPQLPARQREAHKGQYGHVLVIGGDCGMSGAVRMAAEAAARVGAGLVSVATHPEHASTINVGRPELMVTGVQKPADMQPLLDRATVLVIGPGLGKRDWAKALLKTALAMDLPKVVDADALHLLAELGEHDTQWVLTPHPGEAAGLLTMGHAAQVQADRYGALVRIQQEYGGVCVLKGSGTLVRTTGGETFVCQMGNPGMASGGMGDVLSGVIGGFIAQGLALDDAALTGVYIHSAAADKAATSGGERGLLAMDVVKQLRATVNGFVQ